MIGAPTKVKVTCVQVITVNHRSQTSKDTAATESVVGETSKEEDLHESEILKIHDGNVL